ncbi:MAG: AMP-binding protein, partial [Pseudomonadota bacterium]
VALSPISFLKRAESAYAHRESVVYGSIRRNWTETAKRCRTFASALNLAGIKTGDTISVICPNIPEMFELHYSVPMSGAVLNAINTRLEAETIAYILDHADSKLVVADTQYHPLLSAAFEIMGRKIKVIEIVDLEAGNGSGIGEIDYEAFLATGDEDVDWKLPEDEWQALALNYTSGTSGRPKGVVYHHRGAYLMSMGTIAGWSMADKPIYLSVVPMFHCNGWNHPWATAIVGAKLVFTRDPVPERILAAIKEHGVTHFGGAPIVLQMLTESADAPDKPFDPPVNVFTAGAPPPPAILQKSAAIGLNVMQVYGLTETYGHITQCIWRDEWDDLSGEEKAEMQAMQGIAFPNMEEIRVVDRETGADVPKDGQTQGEIAIRGNPVMKGYYKDETANAEAFKDGWFWSGDAAVMHPNSYVQIRDRLKDVIISGGENISSVEVEAVLYAHPAVQAAAIVAQPHEKWGEVPCAFVELREGSSVSDSDIMSFCKERLAGFKTPKTVIFCELPKTSTGKIQKFVLREQAKAL